ncbi:hypothetical protein H4W80_002355 [Nonomuraea angiospora]|uniref:Cupin type-2 domain-containing protein n=2 Tax=Nonomuraea angiospora TaxID=46172 RepID=A0ABR9LUW0_9ACTN|nr:hypothetical protein [Nonomuraea angiospora]
MTTKRYTSPDPELDSYYGDLAAKDLRPLWELGEMFTSEPKAAAVPHRWRAADLHELAGRAGDLVPIERGGDRRVIGLANPGLGGAPFIAPSLWAGVQFLLPGELAPPHRHTAAALRFILGGRGAYTVVDGDSIPMTPGDLVLTPGWTVHEHHNPGDEPMVWLDVLDLPLVIGLEALFFEQRPGNPAQQCPARSASEMFYGQSAGLVPVGNQTPAFDGPSSPLTRVGVSIGDSIAGLYGAFGAVMALLDRQRHPGKSIPLQDRIIDVALNESIYSMMESLVPDYLAHGVQRHRTGGRMEGIAPSNAYLCADAKSVVIAAIPTPSSSGT